eukprot:4038186-Pyramimonas_sp.AAC.2
MANPLIVPLLTAGHARLQAAQSQYPRELPPAARVPHGQTRCVKYSPVGTGGIESVVLIWDNQRPKCCLYVGGLLFETNERDLREAFGRFGRVAFAKVRLRKAYRRGFCRWTIRHVPCLIAYRNEANIWCEPQHNI